MSIFDVDYIKVVWELLVPPDKRMPKWLAWGASVMRGKQWLHNVLFTTYAGGSTDLPYNSGTNYTTGMRVLYSVQAGGAYYGDNAVYEALCINADGSTNTTGFSGVPPSGSNIAPNTMPANIINTAQALAWLYSVGVNYPAWLAQNYIAGQTVYYTNGNAYVCIVNTTSSQIPTNTTYWQVLPESRCLWVKVSNNFIGANERASYSCQKVIYEYALNKWFGTTFRQPVIGLSDIYITKNLVTQGLFYFFPYTEQNNYFLPDTNLGNTYLPFSHYFSMSSVFVRQYDFTIHVRSAVYANLSVKSAQRDGVVRAFADLLCPAGAYYNIVTY